MDLQFSTSCLPRFSLRSSFATARALGLDGLQIALTPALYRRGPERLVREAERHGVAVRSLDLGALSGVGLTREAVAGIAAFARSLPECHVAALPAPRGASQAPGGLNGYLAVVRAYGEALWGHATVTIINAPGGSPGAAGPLDRFPQLRRIACTVRAQASVDHHRLGALMAVRDGGVHVCAPIEMAGIVDRIGGGDAFAAGVLHGVLGGMDDAASLAFGQAAGVLKHYLPGDALTLGVAEVQALVDGERLDVRR